MLSRPLAVLLGLALAASAPAVDGTVGEPTCVDEWPQLRGAHQGHSDATGLPVRWSEASDEIRWKTPLPGRGFSSPVVVDGMVWMTTALGEEPPHPPSLRLLGVDAASGELRVNVEVFAPEAWQPGHPDNSYASPTPVASGGRVWVHFGTYGTAAYDASKLLAGVADASWRVQNTPQEHEVGPGSSPILVRGAGQDGQDLLVVHADATDTQAIVALDAASGEIVWRTERYVPVDEQAYHSVAHRKAFSTPLHYVYDDTPLLLSTSAAHTSAYDPATGRELWRVRHTGYSNVPMPVAGLGFTWINSGFMKPKLLAVRLRSDASTDGDGPLDVTDSRVAWSYHWQVPANPSPLLVKRRLFLISDWGIASWLDAIGGEEIWRQRLGGRYFASPLVAEDRIYAWNVQGETKVLAASDEYELLATNELEAPIRGTPAIACGAIFLRTTEALYRIEARTGEPLATAEPEIPSTTTHRPAS